MSFSFGFGGDDIENDIENDSENDGLAQQVENCTVNDVSLIPPKNHTLHELLSVLPSQISYNLLQVAVQSIHDTKKDDRNTLPHSNITVPRRSLFDIRTQLMAEANPEENENDVLLAGLEHGDLTSGKYEGGFKTWECALDLASLVACMDFEQDLQIVEIGAGSAIPSLAALHKVLETPRHFPVRFTLCDYNEDVLRLATAPNIFLAGQVRSQLGNLGEGDIDLEVEDIDQEMIKIALQRFENQGISFNFVSGAWGEDLTNLMNWPMEQPSEPPMLILASETIYSPASTPSFVDTVMRLLHRNPVKNKAWIAAKKVYFGVGGGVDDFVNQVKKCSGIVKILLDVKGAGVGRVVLEIVAKQ